MDYETYQKKYFTNPPPEQRYNFTGNFGVNLLVISPIEST